MLTQGSGIDLQQLPGTFLCEQHQEQCETDGSVPGAEAQSYSSRQGRRPESLLVGAAAAGEPAHVTRRTLS